MLSPSLSDGLWARSSSTDVPLTKRWFDFCLICFPSLSCAPIDQVICAEWSSTAHFSPYKTNRYFCLIYGNGKPWNRSFRMWSTSITKSKHPSVRQGHIYSSCQECRKQKACIFLSVCRLSQTVLNPGLLPRVLMYDTAVHPDYRANALPSECPNPSLKIG